MEVKEEGFEGTVTLLLLEEVSESLVVNYEQHSICIVDKGYSWLQHFPKGKQYTLTTMLNEKGEIVQWYFDLCESIGSELGIPWWEDLYLDIIVLPSGEVFLLDEDELTQAYEEQIISKEQYEKTITEANKLINLIIEEKLPLLHLVKRHRKELETLLAGGENI